MTDAGAVLITGTSSGLGRRTAETFARAGYRVFAGMREPEGRSAAARAELEALAPAAGGSLEVVALDVTDDAQVEAAVAHVLAAKGRNLPVRRLERLSARVVEWSCDIP